MGQHLPRGATVFYYRRCLKRNFGTSLVVQWLRLCTPKAGGLGMIPVRELGTVTAMVFPVNIYSCESWTVKKAESQRIDVFKLWCWRRLLRVLWTARKSNQSILREINPE